MIYGLYRGVPLKNIKALMDPMEKYDPDGHVWCETGHEVKENLANNILAVKDRL